MSESGLTKRTGQGLAWSLTTLLAQTALNVVSLAILARLLSPQDYGVMSASLIVVAFGTMLASLGLGPTIVQRRELTRAHISVAIVASIGLGSLAMLFQWALAPFIAELMRIEEMTSVTRVLSLVMVMHSFNALCEALLARELKFRNISLARLGSWIAATFGVSIPLAVLGYGYWALVAGTMSQACIYAVSLGVLSRTFFSIKNASFAAAKELLSKGFGFSATQLMNYIATYADNAIVGRSLGAAELGIYSRAFYLISMPATMFGNINRMVVFPAMSQIQDDETRLRQAYLKGLSLSALVAIPTSAFLSMFASDLVAIILGSKWSDAVVPFAIFSAAIYFRIGTKTCGTILLAKGLTTPLAALQFLYAASIVAGVLATAPLGINAVCIAVLIAAALNFCAYAIVGGRASKSSLNDFVSIHVRPIAMAVFIVAAGLFVQKITAGTPEYISISIAALISGAPLLVIFYFKPSLLLGHHGTEVLLAIGGKFFAKMGWKIH